MPKTFDKFITSDVTADGKVNLMLLFILQCKQNEIIFLLFSFSFRFLSHAVFGTIIIYSMRSIQMDELFFYSLDLI